MKTPPVSAAIVLALLVIFTGCDEIISDILAGDAELEKAARSGDPGTCLALDVSKDASRVSDCLGEMARYQKDPAVCDLVEKGYYKDVCIEKAAIAKGDPKLCESTVASRNNCIKGVAVKLMDRSYCDDVTDKDIKNACLLDVALARGDSQNCRDIADAYTRRMCFDGFAEKFVAVQYCDEAETLRDSCVTRIALRKGSTTDCLKLTTGLHDCVFALAEDKDDASLCEAIPSVGTRDKCVHNVAVSKHDTAVCKSIRDAALKGRCIDSTGLNEMQR